MFLWLSRRLAETPKERFRAILSKAGKRERSAPSAGVLELFGAVRARAGLAHGAMCTIVTVCLT